MFAASDLEAGRDAIESLLGVRPVAGGRHPAWGTRNALVSLGPHVYLEVIAPDPGLAIPERGVLFGADGIDAPRLVTWALRTHSIDATAGAAAAAGIDLGRIEAGSRRHPDGILLSWKLTDPYAMPMSGAVPFLIDWGATPHPAAGAPPAGELLSLRIGHPQPARVRAALDVLGVGIEVGATERPELAATVRTSRGLKEIR